MPSSSSKPKTSRKSQRKQCGGVGRVHRRPGFKSKLYHETAAASSGETACPTRLRQDHTWQHIVHTLYWNKYLLYSAVVTVVTGQQLWVDSVILCSGWFCLPRDTGRRLETFMVVATWGRGRCWHLVGRGQGCYSASRSAQDCPRNDFSSPKWQ